MSKNKTTRFVGDRSYDIVYWLDGNVWRANVPALFSRYSKIGHTAEQAIKKALELACDMVEEYISDADDYEVEN